MTQGNGLLDAFYSLGKKINKMRGSDTDNETEEGLVSDKLPELTLSMDNDDIIALTAKWEKAWTDSDVYAAWQLAGEENENYWKGIHFNKPKVDKSRAMVDNVIFEALETYLPQVTRRNPDPMVQLEDSEDEQDENLQFAKKLQIRLGKIADKLTLRLKMKKAARHWAIYLLGVEKFGWDMNNDMPTVKIIRPQRLILDPKATIDEDGYTGKRIGEHREMEASILISLLSKIDAEKGAVDYIKKLVKDDLGTDVGFIEWWTEEYMCWKIKDQVLLKKKNPHWNYDKQNPVMGEDGLQQVDEAGAPMSEKQEGFNHFPVPRMPYNFLSVFNLGKQPVDDTSLIGQNLANQDLVNKRTKQIDKNADSMNGGIVVSLARSGLTQAQAKGVTQALRDGGTVVIPDGAPLEAIVRMSGQALPADIFNERQDNRSRIRDIFGTRGSAPAGLDSEATVRGKIMNRTLDTDRIGGGFSEYLEQFADVAYNWMIQLLYVYDDAYAMQPHPKVVCSVKEGSLLPKDSTSIANQAIDLAQAGKMSLIDLYKNLDYPNPDELAANVWLEANAPEILLGKDPRVAQVIQQRQQAQQSQQQPESMPSQSISFKDLPPDGQAQMAAKVGIQLHAEAIAAHNEAVAAAGGSNPSEVPNIEQLPQ